MAFGGADQAIQDPLLILAEQTQILKELAAIPSRIRLPMTPGHPKKGKLTRNNTRLMELNFSFSCLSFKLTQSPPQLVIPVLFNARLLLQHIPLEDWRKMLEVGLKFGVASLILISNKHINTAFIKHHIGGDVNGSFIKLQCWPIWICGFPATYSSICSF